jgi:hypothetical protein
MSIAIKGENRTWRKLSTDDVSFGEKETTSLFLCTKSLFSLTCRFRIGKLSKETLKGIQSKERNAVSPFPGKLQEHKS